MEIDLYEVIRTMRAMSKRSERFSFSFMSYKRDSVKTDGIVNVNSAILRPSPSSPSEIEDIMLFYLDDDNNPKRCYQPALMTFEGKKIKLN